MGHNSAQKKLKTMRKNDILVCIREDNYCIETLQMVNHPKIGEFVQVEKIIKDEDGTWLCLVGYTEDMFDIACFRPIQLQDLKQQSKEKLIEI